MNVSLRCAGISLIEVMLTLTILAVVALALADGLVTSMRVTSVNEERAAAMRAARDKLEWIAGNKQLLINSLPANPQVGGAATNRSDIYPRFRIDTGNNYGVIVGIETATGLSANSGPFDIFYAQKGNSNGSDPNRSRLQGLFDATALNGTLEGNKPGEVVVMFDEAIVAPRADKTYAYGRDLTGGPTKLNAPFGTPDGQPDGTTFPPLGDMDMDTVIAGGGTAPTWDMRWLAFSPTNAGGPRGRLPVGAVIRWVGASGKEERYELWTVINFFQENFGTTDAPVTRMD